MLDEQDIKICANCDFCTPLADDPKFGACNAPTPGWVWAWAYKEEVRRVVPLRDARCTITKECETFRRKGERHA